MNTIRAREFAARVAIGLLLVGVMIASAGAQEWTRFRGPNGTGISDATNIPAQWSEGDFNWKTPLPGMGHSSPVVWGDKVFVTSADNETGTRFVICVQAYEGRVLWSQSYTSNVHTKHQLNSFASPTPAVDEDRVYVAWSTPEEYTLRALDHGGKEVWNLSLGPFDSQHSCGTSPIVYEDKVIINNDQDGPSSLMAVDRRTGKIAWQVPRKSREVAYSTPCVYHPPGEPAQLIFNSGANGISSVNPLDGHTNWELDVFDKRSVSSPILASGLLIGTCGSGGGGNYAVAIRPGKIDGSALPELAYKITKSAPYVPTAIAKDDLLFLWSDQGVLTCVRAATGEPVYEPKRIGGKFYGSPICVRDRLYCVSDAGEVVVVAAAPEYQLLGRTPLGEACHSTPAVANGVMFIHTFSHLVSLGGKK